MVRSGYKIAQKLLDGGEIYGVSGDWQKLWNLKIPPKVKIFLWRVARDILPNRGNLQKKHVMVPISCATCESDWENSWHQFIVCPMAKACWEELGTWNKVLPLSNEAEGFVRWLFYMFQQVDVGTLENIVMVLWGIWRARNEKLWNRTVKPAASVVSSALQLLTDWRAVHSIVGTQDRTNQHDGERVVWQKPHAQALKCNVDASVQNDSRNIGVGMALRDSVGIFRLAQTNVFRGRIDLKDAEVMAFKEALSWIEGMNVQDVIFESDSKIVIEAINSDKEDDSEFGELILQCREVLRKRPSFSVCFTRRQANKVAHNLARASYFHARPSIWNTPPDFIIDSLNEDCISLET